MTSAATSEHLTVTPTDELRQRARAALERCGAAGDGSACCRERGRADADHRRGAVRGPGRDRADVDAAVARAAAAFQQWRAVPAPVRGALVKRLAELLTEHKADLGELVTHRGRQDRLRGARRGPGDDRHLRLRGRPVAPARRADDASERPMHRLMETWHPLGVVGRDHRVQLPGGGVVLEHRGRAGVRRHGRVEAVARQTPLTALACARCCDRAAADCGAPPDLNQLVIAGADGGEALVDNPAVALVSATGSERMGARGRARGSRPGSGGCCSSWAATTPRSSRRRPTSSWPREGSCSRPPAPPGSAARRCGA